MTCVSDITLRDDPSGKGCMAVLPGSLVTVLRISVPGVSEVKLLKILPSLLDDRIAADIKGQHIAVLEISGDGTALVAVVAVHVMEKAIHLAREAGRPLKSVWPDFMALSVPDAGAVSYIHGPLTAVRFKDGTGMSIETDLAAVILADTPCSPADIAGLPDGEGLATGVFAPAADIIALFRAGRLAFGLMLVVVGVWLGSVYLDITRNAKSVDAYAAAEEKLFQAAFPDVTRIVNIEAQTRAKLAASGADTRNTLTSYLDMLFQEIQKIQGVQLEQVRYDVQEETGIAVTIGAQNFAASEDFIAGLRASGFTVIEGNSRQEAGRVFAELQVRRN